MSNQNVIQFFFELLKKDKLLDSNRVSKFESSLKNYPDCDRLAFELPLYPESNQLDFHLNLKTLSFRKKFESYIRDHESKLDPKWGKILYFVKKWNDPNHSYNKHIPGVFLEFDYNGLSSLPLPALFIKIDIKNISKKEAFAILKSSITTLKSRQFFDSCLDVIHNCIYYLPNTAYLGYFGLMLSRPQNVIRLNIYDLNIHDCIPFLKGLGWTGDENVLFNSIEKLSRVCDQVIVSFDLFEGSVLPKIGLESFITKQPTEDNRWKKLEIELESLGLNAPRYSNIVNNWNKTWLPTQIEWPGSLALSSLSYKKEQIPVIKQLVSHVKLTLEGKEITSKIYVGIGQTHKDLINIPQKEILNSTFNQIEAGVKYLVKIQNQNGLIRDFQLPAGHGDEWITAVIGSLLKEYFDNQVPIDFFNKAIKGLNSRWRPNGLGYNYEVPCDSDSTSWGLRFFQLNNLKKDFDLTPFRNKNLGLGTYAKGDSTIKNYLFKSNIKDFSGWEISHDCVTAPSAKYNTDSLNYILNLIDNNRPLKSYWWKSDFYCYFFALSSIIFQGKLTTKRENYFKEKLKNKAGLKDLFSKSLYFLTACLLKHNDEYTSSIFNQIKKTQLSNGSWPSETTLLVPMPGHEEKNSSVFQWEMKDINKSFTSIFCLICLKMKEHENV